MDLKRIFRGWVLAILLVLVLLVVVMKFVGAGQTYQPTTTSRVVNLVETGKVRSATLYQNTQIIEVLTKNGQYLQATWVGGQGTQLANQLQHRSEEHTSEL